jgi:hypothetical protein
MFRHRLPIVLAAGVAFGCSEPTASKTTEPVGSLLRASASGGAVIHHVTIGGPDVCTGFGAKPGCDANFSLVANQYADGSVSGMWVDRFSQNFGGGGVTVAVTCVAVEGSFAWIGGVVTSPAWNAGTPAILRARDLGNSAANDPPDRFLPLYDPAFFGLSTNCLDEEFFFMLSVVEGNVVIK